MSLMIWIYPLQTPDLYRETQETKRILLFGWSSKKNRATASNFYEVYSWKSGKERHAENFASRGSTPSTFVQRKFDHDKMYKSVFWRIYLECFASLGQDVNVLPCGLVVNVTSRWLGCSPDAKLLFRNKVGIGESKCTNNQRNSGLMDVAQANKNFYFEALGNSLHLNQEHPYYFKFNVSQH